MPQVPTTWMAPNSGGLLEFVVAPPADYLFSPQGLWRQYQSGPNLAWSKPEQFTVPYVNFTAAVQPKVAAEWDGHLAVFVTDGKEFWEQWQTSNAEADSWSGTWQPLGSPGANLTVGEPAIGINQNGTLELFAVASDGKVHHVWQQSKGGDTNWSGWNDFGIPSNVKQCVGTPATASYPNGAQAIFVRTDQNTVRARWQYPPNNGWLRGWNDLGKPPNVDRISDPVVAANQDGRLNVFVMGDDGNVWLRYQNFDWWRDWPFIFWEDWASLARPSDPNVSTELTGPVVASDLQRLVVMVGDTNSDVVWYLWQAGVNDSDTWAQPGNQVWKSVSSPQGVSTDVTNFAAGVNVWEGRLEVAAFALPGATTFFEVYDTVNVMAQGGDSWNGPSGLGLLL
jgi:hypothetical protein